MRRITATMLLFLWLFLGVHSGQLALLQEDSKDPLQIYPLSVSMLPEADRQSLMQGIPIDSQLQLAQLLEDYLS